MENSKLKFILASASPRRKELIGHLKIPFLIKSSDVKEESNSVKPSDYCQDIAFLKGRSIAESLLNEKLNQNYFVVSADTIVCLDGIIYGKPNDREDARRILMKLSGKTHSVFTAVAFHLIHNNKLETLSFVEESKVTFNPISNVILEKYLDSGDSLDKAGAYGIQGPSLTFISRVEGDYANVVGFPLGRFVIEAESFFKTYFSGESSWLDLF